MAEKRDEATAVMVDSSMDEGSAGPYSRKVASNVTTWFAVAVGLQVFGIVLSGILYGAGYSLFPVQLDAMPFVLNDDSSGAFYDSAFRAMQNDARNDLFATTFPNQAERSVSEAPFEIIYSSNTNCLTPNNLASIETLESGLYDSAGYKAACRLEADGNCTKPNSILRFFDGTFESVDNIFRPDPTFARVREIMDAAYNADGDPTGSITAMNLKKILQYNVGKDFQISVLEANTLYCRSMVYTGLPLAGYATVWDRRDEQLSQLSDVHVGTLKPYVDARNSIGVDIEVLSSSAPVRDNVEDDGRRHDLLLLIGTLLVTALILIGYTRSIALPFFAMLGMLSTFVWANMLYRIVCDFEMFALPQVYGGFVLFLAASLDLLLFVDTFNDTGAGKDAASQSSAVRLTTTIGKLRRPIITAAIAAACAFFIQCASPLLAVEAAALFSGIIILVNLANTFFFLPALVLMWNNKWRTDLCLPRDNGQDECLRKKASHWLVDNVVSHSAFKWLVILIGFLLIVVFFIIAVVEIKPDTHQPYTFRDSNEQKDFQDIAETKFGPSQSDMNMQVHWVFGLEELDESGCARTDVRCDGTPVYNQRFDLSSDTAQTQLKELCEDLRASSASTVESLKLRRSESIYNNPLEVSCFVESMSDYFTTSTFTLAQMQTIIATNAAVYPATVYNETGTYYRNFEFGLVDWLATRQKTDAYPSADFDEFHQLVGGVADPGAIRESTGLAYSGKYGGFFRYGVIKVNLTLSAVDIDANDALPAMKAWDEYIASKTPSLALPLQQSFQATPRNQGWAWAQAQDEIEQRTFQGLGLGLLFIAVIATAGLNNWILGLFTTLAVFAVYVVVVGIVGASGWQLGLHEAVAFAYVPGILAFFSVIMASGIRATLQPSKQHCLFEAFNFAGASLVAVGFMSSIGVLFLVGSTLQFSFVFGIIVLCTVLFAVLFAVLMMGAVFCVFWPSEGAGSIVGGATRRSVKISDSQLWDQGAVANQLPAAATAAAAPAAGGFKKTPLPMVQGGNPAASPLRTAGQPPKARPAFVPRRIVPNDDTDSESD